MSRRAISRAVVAVLCIDAAALAQGNDEVVAESLFREGKHWFEQGNYARACPKLAESYRLDPGTGALLALAMCHEADGKLASAWVEYTDVAARSRRESRPDREKAARERAEALEPRLSRLAIVASEGAARLPALEIKLDGVALGRAAWGTPIFVDAGMHTVEAIAPGKKRWTMSAAWDAAPSTQTVVIPPLDDDANVLPADRSAGPPTDRRPSLTPLRAGALIAGGMGGAALVLGSYFGLRAISRNHDSMPGCSASDCADSAARQLRLAAISDGNVSTAAFVTAGVFLGGGVVLWIVGHPDRESVAVSVGPDGAMVQWRARF